MLRTRVRAGPVAGLLMSLVFALLVTVVHSGDRLVAATAPAYGEATVTTLRVPYGPRFVKYDSRTRLQFEEHRLVVPRGTVLDRGRPEHRVAMRFERQQRPLRWRPLGGLFVFVLALSLGLTTYLWRFGQNRLRLLRVQLGLFVAMSLLVVGAQLGLLFSDLWPMWTPLAAVPLLMGMAFDRRSAAVVAIVLAAVVTALADFDSLLLPVLLTQGATATLVYLDRRRPRRMVWAGGLAGMSAAALYAALMTIFEGHFDVVADLLAGVRSELLACVGGGVASGLLAVVLRAPAERLLGNVPRERLLELQDLSQPLLQRLAREAPGTFEHSRAMANLAEQAVSAIGCDALLTRVGAYYHDLGKSIRPKYFVENLLPDEVSPHLALQPEVSADAIMMHVVMGAKILRDGGIPEPVVEFCYTHHGTSVLEFFWNKCEEQGNPRRLEVSAFTYPGMKPQTKETAILMLVDSIEAASRTIDTPTRDQFEQMIQRLFFTKLEQGQLDDCGLSLAELRIITTRITDTLVSMYHHRIKYQWQVRQAEEFGVPARAVRSSAPEITVHRERYSSVDLGMPAAAEDGETTAEPVRLEPRPQLASVTVQRERRAAGDSGVIDPHHNPNDDG